MKIKDPMIAGLNFKSCCCLRQSPLITDVSQELDFQGKKIENSLRPFWRFIDNFLKIIKNEILLAINTMVL